MATGIVISSVFIIYIGVMLIAGIFVYRDAGKRNMNQMVWALVAFFGPFLVGAIIYFVCRNPIIDLQCSKCGAPVTKTETICPKCGSSLITKCPECSFPIQKNWKSCPQCGSSLPEDFNQPIRTYKKESGIGVIILIIIIAFIVLGYVACSVYSARSSQSEGYGYVGEVGMYNITAEDLSANETLKKWIDGCNDSKKPVHGILSKEDGTLLIYVKGSDRLLSCNSMDYTLYDESAEIYLSIDETEYSDDYGYDFFMFDVEDSYGTGISDNISVEIIYKGNHNDVKLTVTESDISMATWRD